MSYETVSGLSMQAARTQADAELRRGYIVPSANVENIVEQLRRQLGNKERANEEEFGKAILTDLNAHGLRSAALVPGLRVIKVGQDRWCPADAYLCCARARAYMPSRAATPG